ncbi:MAG: hypothetical protein GY880_16725, partial [Planctomycetaceae bacterium]|nr:hypothetical protein [Planctomycetaceae bacterium]
MNQKPIEHPSVWRGSELERRSEWLQQLTETEAKEIECLFADAQPSLQENAPVLFTRLKKVQVS